MFSLETRKKNQNIVVDFPDVIIQYFSINHEGCFPPPYRRAWDQWEELRFRESRSVSMLLRRWPPWPLTLRDHRLMLRKAPRVNLAHGEHFQKTEHCGILKLCILTPKMLCHSSPDEDLKLSILISDLKKGSRGQCHLEGARRENTDTRVIPGPLSSPMGHLWKP